MHDNVYVLPVLTVLPCKLLSEHLLAVTRHLLIANDSTILSENVVNPAA